jgi:hypothetical protein
MVLLSMGQHLNSFSVVAVKKCPPSHLQNKESASIASVSDLVRSHLVNGKIR